MTPTKYADALARPEAWQALYWLKELLTTAAGDHRNFEPDYGSPELGRLEAEPASNTLRAVSVTIQARFGQSGRQDTVLLDLPADLQPASQSSAEPSSLHSTIAALLRCLAMPPRRDLYSARCALECLECGVLLGREVAAEMTANGREPNWLEISELLIEIEQLSTVHRNACVLALNQGLDGDGYDAIDQLEARIQDLLDRACNKRGLSRMLLSFQRDARGATVRVVGRGNAIDKWFSELQYRGRNFTVLDNPLRSQLQADSPNIAMAKLRFLEAVGLAKREAAADPTCPAQVPSREPAPTRSPAPAAHRPKASSHASKAQPKVQPEPQQESAPPTSARSQAVAMPVAASSTTSTAALPAAQAIPASTLAILRAGTWPEPGLFKLPPGQLDRKVYEEVRSFIAMADGRWVTKRQGFQFTEGGEDRLRAGVLSGELIDPKDAGFFPTPPAQAAALAQDLDLRPGMKVADPSAGRGALALAAAAIVGKENVTCYELLPHNAQHLRELGFKVIEGDFLAVKPEPTYDAIIQNPPFSRLDDVRHVVHASRFLLPGGRLASIMSPSFQHVQARDAEAFRDLLAQAGELRRELPAGTFKDAGTMVRTVVIHLEADRLPWAPQSPAGVDEIHADRPAFA